VFDIHAMQVIQYLPFEHMAPERRCNRPPWDMIDIVVLEGSDRVSLSSFVFFQ
jgi:hypothetical protein